MHHRVHDLGGERLAHGDVLRVLLALVSPLDSTRETDGSSPAAASAKNWSIFGALSSLACEHVGTRTTTATSVVVAPRDVVAIQRLDDRAVLRLRTSSCRDRVDRAERRPAQQEAAVRVRLAETRREPAVAQRERLREAVIEGDVAPVPVAHRRGSARAAHEPVHGAVVPLDVHRVPVLAERVCLARVRHVKGRTSLAVHVGVAGGGLAAVVEREAVAATEHAEVAVVRVVLLHDHDDVLDLRDQVRTFGLGDVGPLTACLGGVVVPVATEPDAVSLPLGRRAEPPAEQPSIATIAAAEPAAMMNPRRDIADPATMSRTVESRRGPLPRVGPRPIFKPVAPLSARVRVPRAGGLC